MSAVRHPYDVGTCLKELLTHKFLEIGKGTSLSHCGNHLQTSRLACADSYQTNKSNPSILSVLLFLFDICPALYRAPLNSDVVSSGACAVYGAPSRYYLCQVALFPRNDDKHSHNGAPALQFTHPRNSGPVAWLCNVWLTKNIPQLAVPSVEPVVDRS